MFIGHFDRIGKIRPLCAAAAVACVLIGGGGRAQAQKALAPSSLPAVFQQPYADEARGQSFTELTSSFSRVAGISIVADGEPALAKSDLRFKGTAQQALDQIADAFDFNWTVTKSGIVLMSKRFTSLNDRPQISLIETRQIIKDMSKALQTVTFSMGFDFAHTQVQAIYDTLTPAQIRALRSGQEVAAAQLLPGTFDMLKEAILSNAFGGPLRDWNRLSEDLDLLPASFLQAQERRSPASNPPHYYEVLWNRRASNGGLSYGAFAIIPIVEKNAGRDKPEGHP